MTDDQLDERLRALAEGYHHPPETPREDMWQAIQRGRVAQRSRRRPTWRPYAWGGLAAAAVLVVGILIGTRIETSQPQLAEENQGVPAQPGSGSDRAFRMAAVQYLGETEEFLTVFRADARQGQLDPTASARARQLLSSNRLLMDSPAAQDPEINALLMDLELVLAEISRVSGSAPARGEAGLINEGIEQGGLLERLRTAVPAGQPGIGL